MPVTRYVALLRGINVGKLQLAMEPLRAVFTKCGCDDVSTYLRTGNVVFASGTARAKLGAELEKAVAAEFGVEIAVLLRTAEELATLAAGNPFADQEQDLTKLHVTFLAAEPMAAKAGALAVPPGQPERLQVTGSDVYLHCPDGYGRTKVNNAFIERRLGVAATTRNWRTVRTLVELTSA